MKLAMIGARGHQGLVFQSLPDLPDMEVAGSFLVGFTLTNGAMATAGDYRSVGGGGGTCQGNFFNCTFVDIIVGIWLMRVVSPELSNRENQKT